MSQTMAASASRVRNAAQLPIEDLLMSLASRGVRVNATGVGLRVDSPSNDPRTERLVAALSVRENEALQHIRLKPGTVGLQIQAPSANRRFKLTDLQSAYHVGELDFLDLHTPAYIAQGYEVPGIDIERLTKTLRWVMYRHEMLRAVLADADEQEIRELDSWAPTVVDWSDLSAQEARERFNEVRDRAGDSLAPLDVGPQLACTVFQARGTRFVLLAVRLIVLDARSIGLIWSDIADAHENEHREDAEGARPAGLYKSYVEAFVRHRGSQVYRNSIAYWQRRLASLPPAPALPGTDIARAPRAALMRRAQHSLSTHTWELLQARSREMEVSVNAMLCASYMDVLCRWSGTTDFSVTVLASTRALTFGSEALERCVGNFGTTMLVAPDRTGKSFLERARASQLQLASDLQHCFVSAIEVMRRARQGDTQAPGNNPYVFASGLDAGSLGGPLPNQIQAPGWRCVFKAMHTPQVLLDHQVFEDRGKLVCNFDYVFDAFPPGLVDELVAYHAHLLELLANKRSSWTSEAKPSLPTPLMAARAQANRTAKAFGQREVFGDFRAHLGAKPTSPAIVTLDSELSYEELQAGTGALHAQLVDRRGDPPPLVGILAEKSLGQYLAAVAILRYGSAYVPLNIDWPSHRLKHFIAQSGLDCVLADARGARLISDLDGTLTVIPTDSGNRSGDPPPPAAADLDMLAYVIYTSGSTGEPKGVAVPRRGVLNTVVDVCERFDFTSEDRILSLSELNFDLSAFDLLGALHCGAAVVIPPYSQHPDPESWVRCLRQTGVTVWNSVPALMEMLLDYLGTSAPSVLGGLRLVMLSGDWIPLDLPERLHAADPSVRVVALGGATEASIWSNYHIVDRVDPAWKSIPYGLPLANQRFHVLDGDLDDVPTWVPGDLYIAGHGVASEYFGQTALTNESFLSHPRMQERIYRTGDRGRYWSDGSIEFLGRVDRQVKVRGHRLDLLEIEKHLDTIPGVGTTACVVSGEGVGQTLVALIVPSGDRPLDFDTVREKLRENLPAYAIPDTFRKIDAVPLTANGKRDPKGLLAFAQAARPTRCAPGRRPSSTVERDLVRLWEALCGVEVGSVDDDFFAVGGTSLLAVRLVRGIEATFGIRLALSSLFEQNTIEAQARLVEGTSQPEQSSVIVPIREGEWPAVIVIHPIGGHVLCYRPLVDSLPPGLAVYGIQSPPTSAMPRTLADLTTSYAETLQALRGPRDVHIVGWSMGGVLGIELAHALERFEMPAASLTLIDVFICAEPEAVELSSAEKLSGFFADYLQDPSELGLSEARSLEEAVSSLRLAGRLRAEETLQALRPLYLQYARLADLLFSHRVSSLPGCPIDVFAAANQPADSFSGLSPFHVHYGMHGGGRDLRVAWIAGDHYAVVNRAGAAAVATQILERLASTTSSLPMVTPETLAAGATGKPS